MTEPMNVQDDPGSETLTERGTVTATRQDGHALPLPAPEAAIEADLLERIDLDPRPVGHIIAETAPLRMDFVGGIDLLPDDEEPVTPGAVTVTAGNGRRRVASRFGQVR